MTKPTKPAGIHPAHVGVRNPTLYTPADMYVVVEYDEDKLATTWRTAFRTMSNAASAIEAHHAQEWTNADMGDEPDELVILPDGEGGCTIALLDMDTPWLSWTVTPVTIAD